MDLITLIGVSVISIYTISQILIFLGFEPQTYMPYFMFLIFILLSIIILPNQYHKA